MIMSIRDISAGYLRLNKSKSITAKDAKEILRDHKEFTGKIITS
jgi:hypothetical protein